MHEEAAKATALWLQGMQPVATPTPLCRRSLPAWPKDTGESLAAANRFRAPKTT